PATPVAAPQPAGLGDVPQRAAASRRPGGRTAYKDLGEYVAEPGQWTRRHRPDLVRCQYVEPLPHRRPIGTSRSGLYGLTKLAVAAVRVAAGRGQQRSAVTATAWRPLSPNAAEQALFLAGVCFRARIGHNVRKGGALPQVTGLAASASRAPARPYSAGWSPDWMLPLGGANRGFRGGGHAVGAGVPLRRPGCRVRAVGGPDGARSGGPWRAGFPSPRSARPPGLPAGHCDRARSRRRQRLPRGQPGA